MKKDTIYVQIGDYVLIADIEYMPAAEPKVLQVDFEPALMADDITYDCDIIIGVGKTISSSSVILHYLDHCFINDVKLIDVIDNEA